MIGIFHTSVIILVMQSIMFANTIEFNRIIVTKGLPILYETTNGFINYTMRSVKANESEIVDYCRKIYKKPQFVNALNSFKSININFDNKSFNVHPILCITSKYQPLTPIFPPGCYKRYRNELKCIKYHYAHKESVENCANNSSYLYSLFITEPCKNFLMKFRKFSYICCPPKNTDQSLKLMYERYRFHPRNSSTHDSFVEMKRQYVDLVKKTIFAKKKLYKEKYYNLYTIHHSSPNMLEKQTDELRKEFKLEMRKLFSLLYEYIGKIEKVHIKDILYKVKKCLKTKAEQMCYRQLLNTVRYKIVPHIRKMCKYRYKYLAIWGYIPIVKQIAVQYVEDHFKNKTIVASISKEFDVLVKQISHCKNSLDTQLQNLSKEMGKQFNETIMLKPPSKKSSSHEFQFVFIVLMVCALSFLFFLMWVCILPHEKIRNCFNKRQVRWSIFYHARGANKNEMIQQHIANSIATGTCQHQTVACSHSDAEASINIYENPGSGNDHENPRVVIASNKKQNKKSMEKKSLIENMEEEI